MAVETTLVIADDHPLFRAGLRQAIEREAGFKVLAEAEDGEVALQTITTFRPQVAVLDIEMPKKSGIDVARALIKDKVPSEIIFLTMYDDEELFNEAMDLGAKGYVLKESAVRDILQSIRSVIAGKHYISPSISDYLMKRGSRERELLAKKPSLADLTVTERRVLKLLAEAKTSKEIADAMHISPKTVDNHRLNIAQKLDLRGTHKLLQFALENKGEL